MRAVCVCVLNRRERDRLRETERQREKESFPLGVDTTCLDSRWGRSDGEVLMVFGVSAGAQWVIYTHIYMHIGNTSCTFHAGAV